MSKTSLPTPSNNPIGATISPSTNSRQLSGSRSRFEQHRQQVRGKQLAQASNHSTRDFRETRSRVRSAWQLIRQFFALLIPFRQQVFWILASATIATLIGLLPPAGT